MLKEVNQIKIEKVQPILKQLPQHLSIVGVLKGINKGRLFVDNVDNPKSLFMKSPEGLYIAGELNDDFCKELSLMLKNDLFVKAKENGNDEYVLFYPKGYDKKGAKVLEGLYPMKDKRHYYELDLDTYQKKEISKNILMISEDLFKQDIIGLDDVREQIEDAYTTLENYYQHGVGCVYVDHNQVISWCKSDTIINKRCEIGIETEQNYRQKGFGFEVLKATLNLCKDKNLDKVGWHCWESNIPSINIAIKANFKLIDKLEILYGFYDELANYITNGNHYLMIEKDYKKSAKFYNLALEQNFGQFWHYYNAACLFYIQGEIKLAKHYYQEAVKKGWNGLDNWNKDWINFVYHEDNASEIEEILR